MLDTSVALLACKICRAPATSRFRVERPDEQFSIFECSECRFRFIDHLDEVTDWDSAGSTAIEDGLEFNADRIARNVALLRKEACGKRLLDIGCGAGGFMLAADDFHATGIELDRRYASIARARGLSVSDQPIGSKIWDDAQFDAVTLWDVIEHVNDPAKMIADAANMLSESGVLLIDTPNREGPLYRAGELTAALTGGRHLSTMGVQYSAAIGCHKQIFTAEDLRRILSAAGFFDITISVRSEISFPAAHYLRGMGCGPKLTTIAAPIAKAAVSLLPTRNKLIVVARKHKVIVLRKQRVSHNSAPSRPTLPPLA